MEDNNKIPLNGLKALPNPIILFLYFNNIAETITNDIATRQADDCGQLNRDSLCFGDSVLQMSHFNARRKTGLRFNVDTNIKS